jgi:hypothetical protein
VAPGVGADAPTLQETAETSMASGVNVTGLTLRAVATPLAAVGDGMQTAITVELTYPLAPGTQRIHDTLALSVYALDPDARVKARTIRQLRFAGAAPAQDAVTVLLDDLVELPSDALTIRIGVASQQLGRAGTVHLPLIVPDPTAGDVQLSGERCCHWPGRPASTGAQRRFDCSSRALSADDRANVFARGDGPRLRPRLLARRRRPQITVAITGATRQQPTLTGIETLRGRAHGTFAVDLPLAGLTSGPSVIEIGARLGRHVATRQTPVTIK